MPGFDLLIFYTQNNGVDFKYVVEVAESLATIAAIVAGLWWFRRRREVAPRSNTSHEVTFMDLKNGTVYVGVGVCIENKGNVAITPDFSPENPSAVVIEEVLPYLSKHLQSQELSPEYKMGFLGKRTFPPNLLIEPGEEHTVLFEFVIQKRTKAIKVYSHLHNSYNRGIGWDRTTTHEVKL